MKSNYCVIHLTLTIFFALFLSNSIFSQTSNKLKSNQLIEEYEQFRAHRLTDVSEALTHANRAYELSVELVDSSFMNKSARAIGWLLNSMGEYDTAYFYLEKCISISKAQNDLNQLRYVFNDAGLNRLNLSIYDEALDYFNESLKVRDELKDYPGKALAYNNIGLVYYHLEDYYEAIGFFKKGLAISEEFENISGESMNLMNIGLSYHLLEDYDNALRYFKQTLIKCEENCPIDVEIQAIGAIGVIYFETEQYNDAFEELNRVISMSIEYDVIRYLPAYYHYLALIEFQRQEYDQALADLKISDKYANRLQDVEWKKNNLDSYADIYAAQGDYKRAYEYELKLVEAKDSILNADVIKSISDIHVNLQQDKDASIILGKDLEISERVQQLYLFTFTILMSTILVALLYKNNNLRKRINQKLDSKVKERTENLFTANEALTDSRAELDNFIYRTSHDIQGPLTTLQGLCDIGLMEVKDKTGVEYLTRLSDTAYELNGIIHRLQTVNQIISSKVVRAPINFESLISEIIIDEQSKSKEYEDVKTKFKVHDMLPFKSDESLLVIIIKNLVSNAFKFYDTQKKQTEINIEVFQRDKNMVFEIKDNGIGIQLENTNDLFRMFSRFSGRTRTGGIGLFLVKTAVDKLQGTVSVNKIGEDELTTFVVELPYVRRAEETYK